MLRKPSSFVVLSILATVLTGAAGAEVDFEDVAPDLENLRSVFNRDAGKVRLILLAAPT